MNRHVLMIAGIALIPVLIASPPLSADIGFGPVSGVENQLEELDEKVDDATGTVSCRFSTSADLAPPHIDDIDGDQSKEIVFGSQNGIFYAINRFCFEEWSVDLETPVTSRADAGDLDSFELEVFVSAGDTVFAFDTSEDSGSLLWTYDGLTANVCSSARYAQLDVGPSVLVGGKDNNLHAINTSGGQRWTASAADWVCATPAAGDIDDDNNTEVVFGSRDNTVYAVGPSGGSEWPRSTGDKVFSSPALGDLKSNGKLQTVVGSDDSKLYQLAGGGGAVNWSPNLGDAIRNAPALGELDGDGELEVAITLYDLSSKSGFLYVLENTGTVKWKRSIDYPTSPALGDVDGDGSLEIVVGNDNGVVTVFESDGDELWSYSIGSSLVSTESGIVDAPAIADVDGDGVSEIAVGARNGTLYLIE